MIRKNVCASISDNNLYLSGENLEKLFPVGIFPAKLLYETFLQIVGKSIIPNNFIVG